MVKVGDLAITMSKRKVGAGPLSSANSKYRNPKPSLVPTVGEARNVSSGAAGRELTL